MPELPQLVSVFGPVAGIFLFLWWQKNATPRPDPARDVSAQLDAIRADLEDALDKLNTINTSLEVIKDRDRR